MNEPQGVSPRRRLQELLAIPDSRRTEAEWDELNELEISLAPVNQLVDAEKRFRPPNSQGGQSQGGQGQGGDGRQGRGGGHKGRKPPMRSQRRPQRAAES